MEFAVYVGIIIFIYLVKYLNTIIGINHNHIVYFHGLAPETYLLVVTILDEPTYIVVVY